MTADEERQGAEMFAAGRSERDVAEALGCSPSSAHRLRERLERAGAVTGNQAGETPVSDQDGSAEDGSGLEMTPVRRAFGSDVVLTHPGLAEIDAAGAEIELEAERAELADLVTAYGQRAQISLTAIQDLEAERLRILADGGDAVQLRDKVATARQDLQDWTDATGLHQQKLAVVEERLAGFAARRDLEGMRGQLAPAVAERDAAIRSTGGRMATAVLAVKAAAEEFTAALADETAARDRAELLAAQVASLAGSLGEPGPDVPAEPESTVLNVRGGDIRGAELELVRAMNAAKLGRAELVAKHLAEAFGWLPQSREEQAADAELWRQKRAAMDRQMLAPKPAPQAWTRPDTASVGVDQNGREVGYPGYRPPRAPHPLDAYWGGAPYTG